MYVWGHHCTNLHAGRNLGYVIMRIILNAKTNFRYVKNVFAKLWYTELV